MEQQKELIFSELKKLVLDREVIFRYGKNHEYNKQIEDKQHASNIIRQNGGICKKVFR